jgi:hypothetical protein
VTGKVLTVMKVPTVIPGSAVTRDLGITSTVRDPEIPRVATAPLGMTRSGICVKRAPGCPILPNPWEVLVGGRPLCRICAAPVGRKSSFWTPGRGVRRWGSRSRRETQNLADCMP